MPCPGCSVDMFCVALSGRVGLLCAWPVSGLLCGSVLCGPSGLLGVSVGCGPGLFCVAVVGWVCFVCGPVWVAWG
eukprot:512642-Lingulodinium_polyedra.AAC.1